MKTFIIPMLKLTSHGGNRILIELANALVSRGTKVKIITLEYDKKCPFIINENIEIELFKTPLSNKYFSFLFFSLFFWIKKRDGIYIANHFLTSYGVYLASIIYKNKNIYFIQGVEYEAFKGLKKLLISPFCILTYFLYDKIIYGNNNIEQKIYTYNKKKSVLNFSVGVSDSFFLQFSKNKKEYDFILFLRKESYKRLDRMLYIISNLKKYNIICVTQDDYIIKKYLPCGINIKKPGSDNELIKIISSSKYLIYTSDYEGFALPPLECMALGVPVIYYPCVGPDIYCNESNSIPLIGDNDENLSLIKNTLAISDESYNLLSTASKKTAENYKLSKFINKLTSYLITM